MVSVEWSNVEPEAYGEAKAFAEEHGFDYLGPLTAQSLRRARTAPAAVGAARSARNAWATSHLAAHASSGARWLDSAESVRNRAPGRAEGERAVVAEEVIDPASVDFRWRRQPLPGSWFVGGSRNNQVMASTNPAQTTLVIPSDGPHSKFVRYARAVAKEHRPLFPITPATRPLVVGLDLRTLGVQPADYEDLVHVLRRDVVTPKLMVFADDDASLAEAWMQACEVEERYVIDYTDPQSAGRFMDAMEFGVSTMRGEECRGWRSCKFFDLYTLLDAQNTPATDLSVYDRIRGAVLASAGYGLGTDVVVSLAPTVGRADVGDNDIVTTVRPTICTPCSATTCG